MPPLRTTSTARSSLWFLSQPEQIFVAALLLAAQTALVALWMSSGRRQTLVDIDRQPRRDMQFLVDINTADASEFALLPDIGQTLASRIVAWRDEHGPFTSLDDLRQVHGVGPRTLEKIRPCLAPLADSRRTRDVGRPSALP